MKSKNVRKILIVQLTIIELVLVLLLIDNEQNSCATKENNNLLVYNYSAGTLLAPRTVKEEIEVSTNVIDEDKESKEEVKEENGILENVEGNVEIDNVAFSYDKSKSLIENLNVKAPHGTRVAIVGPTGCGKTTIINLLMRFYDPDSGKIKIDGKDILSVTRHSLRSSYGMVLQETWIKSGTVRENITFGKDDATEEEIVSAAKKSHCYDFISRLPNGLDTVLEENSLSEGQKQLSCILLC